MHLKERDMHIEEAASVQLTSINYTHMGMTHERTLMSLKGNVGNSFKP